MELGSRPVEAIRTEQLFAALERRGTLLSRKHQVLAATVGARYCELAVTDTGLGVTLCEYRDEAAASAGCATSRRLFDPIVPGRTLTSRGSSVLTLTQPDGERAVVESRVIAETFASLSPVKRAP
jgi:hypothetical protein